jgi:hypothetical protein
MVFSPIALAMSAINQYCLGFVMSVALIIGVIAVLACCG